MQKNIYVLDINLKLFVSVIILSKRYILSISAVKYLPT